MSGRAIYTGLMQATRAYARWEYECSMNILHNKKRLLLLLLMCLPVIIPAMAHAASLLPESLGGKAAYAPAFFTPKIFYGSILVGLCAGLITGCIGAGGGFIITPALMSFGVKGILAVGTDQFHIFAKAIMGSAVHKKLGNINVKLAISFLVGSFIGVTLGGYINRALYNYNPIVSDLVISTIYALILGFLGIYAMADYLKYRKVPETSAEQERLTGLARWLQSIKLPPIVKFDEDKFPGGRSISFWFVAIVGAAVGLCAAMMGVGGGFLTFPAFVYGLGVSTSTTVGTDVFQIIFTAGYSSIIQYAIYGYVFYTLAMGMLLGSLIGVQVGAITTKVVSGSTIKGFYAITILAGFVNRFCALPGKMQSLGYLEMSAGTANMINTVGNVLFFGIITFFGLWVFAKFFANVGRLRADAIAKSGLSPGTGKGVSQ